MKRESPSPAARAQRSAKSALAYYLEHAVAVTGETSQCVAPSAPVGSKKGKPMKACLFAQTPSRGPANQVGRFIWQVVGVLAT